MKVASPLGIVVGALVAAAACGGSSSTGGERQPCRKAGDAGGCEPGLVCMSDRCVRPPPADCSEVADSLVSIELGNYAAKEERARLLPAKRALCERQRVSAKEAECLARAEDEWAAGACVPRMFARAEASSCEPVIAKLRAMVTRQVQGANNLGGMLDKVMDAFARSCAQDEWPEAMRQCILAAPIDKPEAMNACEKTIPPALMEKIQRRITGTQ